MKKIRMFGRFMIFGLVGLGGFVLDLIMFAAKVAIVVAAVSVGVMYAKDAKAHDPVMAPEAPMLTIPGKMCWLQDALTERVELWALHPDPTNKPDRIQVMLSNIEYIAPAPDPWRSQYCADRYEYNVDYEYNIVLIAFNVAGTPSPPSNQVKVIPPQLRVE
jgi:hypothetical protein